MRKATRLLHANRKPTRLPTARIPLEALAREVAGANRTADFPQLGGAFLLAGWEACSAPRTSWSQSGAGGLSAGWEAAGAASPLSIRSRSHSGAGAEGGNASGGEAGGVGFPPARKNTSTEPAATASPGGISCLQIGSAGASPPIAARLRSSSPETGPNVRPPMNVEPSVHGHLPRSRPERLDGERLDLEDLLTFQLQLERPGAPTRPSCSPSSSGRAFRSRRGPSCLP